MTDSQISTDPDARLAFEPLVSAFQRGDKVEVRSKLGQIRWGTVDSVSPDGLIRVVGFDFVAKDVNPSDIVTHIKSVSC